MREQRVERVAHGGTGGLEHDDLFAAELAQDLSARTTREAGRGVGTYDGGEPYLAVLGYGVGDHTEDGIALGADRKPVGSVLDVAAGVHDTAFRQNRGSYTEAAVWRVGLLRSCAGGFDDV